MESVGIWSAPLLLVPGVGLLILSTSARFGRLHDEFHRLSDSGNALALQHLLNRAKLIKQSLVALYLSISILAISSLVGTASHAYLQSAARVAECLTALGVLSLAYASVQLVRESLRLFEIFTVEAERSGATVRD